MKALLALAVLTAICRAQDPLAAGRELTASLKLEQQADAVILRAVGLERAQTLLMAVLGQGQSPSATTADWKNMHRATDGLIELYVEKGEWFRAAIFASLQDGNYRHYEHDYRSALAASRRELELQLKSGLTDSLDLPWAAIGRNLMSLGETAEALKHFREAQRLTQNPVSKMAGHNWRDIVQAELALGHKDAAQQEVTRFLDQARAAPAEFRASALLAQADLLLDQQQYLAALDVLKQSRQSGVDDYELINQLMSCVLLSMRSVSYGDALTLARRMDTEFTGLPISISAFARQSVQVRRRMAGDIDGVLREQVAQLEGARAAKSLPGQIETLRAIATSYRASNSISNQIAALEEALELEKTLLTPAGLPANSAAAYSYFRLLDSLGEANLRIREIGKARRAFDEVTKKIELIADGLTQKRMGSLYGEAVLGKAGVAEMDDDADTAREILQKALAGSIKLAQFSREDVLWQAARLERGQNEFAAANKYYAQTVEAISGTRNLQYEAVCRIEYAHFLGINAGRIPDAAALAEQQLKAAQALAETMNLADGRWRVLYEFGILAEAKKETAEALRLYRESVARLEALRAGLTQQEQRQSLVDNEAVQDLYRRILALLAAAGDTPHAWEMLERAKARSFLESMQGKRFHSAGKPDAALAEITDLEGRIAGLRVQMLPDNEAVLRGSGREPAVLKNELRQLEAKFALVRQQAALSQTRAGQTIAANPVPLERVRALLPPGTALIEYGLVSDGLVAFVATRTAARQVRWDVKTDALRKDVMRLRAMLADEHSGEEMPVLLKSVSERVIAPVIKKLPAGTERLIVVPAGHLHYLPFQVLEANGRALIEQYTISYLPSASVLGFLGQPEKKNGEIFLGALGKVAVEGWAPLAGTLRETGEIARLYPHPARASELEFTHDRARDALLRYDVVHFATHGLLDEQAPLFSALLTAQTAGQPSRLSLYELPDLELRARLVILSACETGLGKLQGGDEVAGLTRTFLLAGANTVVSSLWKVSDDSTALLMQGFHRRLRAGLPPARAMRESAAEVRKQFPHPFHWAPFVVTGIQ